MRIRTIVGVAMALVVSLPAVSRAQRDTTQRDTMQRDSQPPRMGPPRGGPMGPGGRGADRARIMRQIRQSFTRAVRTQVGLSDDQMRKLAPINQKFGRQRQALAQEERSARGALRDELYKASPDEAKVAQLSDELQQFPRKRLDLNDAEDKELSAIMTPVQLARYRALQERVQRQLDLMRPPMGAEGPPPPPPGDTSTSLLP